ncbi:hypothetical protein C8F04DRAFT_1234251 [Mycena alexandri]|uniref:Uncharacterized protein n=1 Tax=Mycena alexandri TaxID=1745969 RepID=A0AAD6SVD5_9AGAR|nr:hypothetical protein C8F04DRAFT_1234251 [Mycena alexandri]
MSTISRPKWAQSRTSGADLLKAMPGWSDLDFQKFKAGSTSNTGHVMSRAKTYKLDTYADSDAQDPAKWQELLTDCRTHFPALDNFEGQWPLEMYYTKWTLGRRIAQEITVRGRDRATIATRGSGSEELIKDNAQIRTVHSSPRSTAEGTKSELQRQTRPTLPVIIGSVSSARPFASTGPLRPTQSETTFNRASPDGEHSQGSSSSLKEADSRFNHSAATLSASPSRSVSRSLREKFYWSSCVLCGSGPQIPTPASETTQLRKCFDGRTDLLCILALLGVTADHHFRALIRLGDRGRHDFLHGSALKGRLTYLEGARKVRLTEFDRPPVGLEKYLADYRAGYTHVMRHMKIREEEDYFEIVDLIERQIPWYLDIASPFAEQDEAQLDALICKEKPSLRKYDDLWPVDVHIRRFLSARYAGLPGTLRESHPGSTSSIPTAPPHECPLLRAHPHSRVPSSLDALLVNVGMKELGPAFLFLGIRREDQLASIVTSPRTRAQFLAELSAGAGGSLAGCSEFQRMTMGWVVERV